MSEFSVHRTADTIPALRYCLLLDGVRIAGGKPDYRGNNHVVSWQTSDTYGPVDEIRAENAKLRELVKLTIHDACSECPHKKPLRSCEGCNIHEKALCLGVEVE